MLLTLLALSYLNSNGPEQRKRVVLLLLEIIMQLPLGRVRPSDLNVARLQAARTWQVRRCTHDCRKLTKQ